MRSHLPHFIADLHAPLHNSSSNYLLKELVEFRFDPPLQRHPFLELVRLADELLHTPYDDSDFHGHISAVITEQHLLRCLGEW